MSALISRRASGKSLPFGKVVLLGVEGFTEDNAYDRHKELDFLRYDLDLKGFMMRAVSQYMREWCRISREALSQGFSALLPGIFAHDPLSGDALCEVRRGDLLHLQHG